MFLGLRRGGGKEERWEGGKERKGERRGRRRGRKRASFLRRWRCLRASIHLLSSKIFWGEEKGGGMRCELLKKKCYFFEAVVVVWLWLLRLLRLLWLLWLLWLLCANFGLFFSSFSSSESDPESGFSSSTELKKKMNKMTNRPSFSPLPPFTLPLQQQKSIVFLHVLAPGVVGVDIGERRKRRRRREKGEKPYHST